MSFSDVPHDILNEIITYVIDTSTVKNLLHSISVLKLGDKYLNNFIITSTVLWKYIYQQLGLTWISELDAVTAENLLQSGKYINVIHLQHNDNIKLSSWNNHIIKYDNDNEITSFYDADNVNLLYQSDNKFSHSGKYLLEYGNDTLLLYTDTLNNKQTLDNTVKIGILSQVNITDTDVGIILDYLNYNHKTVYKVVGSKLIKLATLPENHDIVKIGIIKTDVMLKYYTFKGEEKILQFRPSLGLYRSFPFGEHIIIDCFGVGAVIYDVLNDKPINYIGKVNCIDGDNMLIINNIGKIYDRKGELVIIETAANIKENYAIVKSKLAGITIYS